MKLTEFISKWSAWWILNKDRETLNRAFRKELEALRQPEFKPLEWNPYYSGYISQPLGMCYIVWQHTDDAEIWFLRIGHYGANLPFSSESGAREFAQKDFESKVMKYIIKK